MALTKTEAAKLSNDLLLRGVIDTIVKESSVLTVLPFTSVVGNSLTYNREATNPTAAFYDVGDTWTEATPTFTQVQATLKILGGDADVDNFLEQTYADTNDLQAEVIAKRAKSIAHLFSEPNRTQSTAGRASLDRSRRHRTRGRRLRSVPLFLVEVPVILRARLAGSLSFARVEIPVVVICIALLTLAVSAFMGSRNAHDASRVDQIAPDRAARRSSIGIGPAKWRL